MTEKIFIFLKDLKNFNDNIFRKDVTYDNIKIKIKKLKNRTSFSF